MRKILIGLVSLGSVLAAYLLYIGVSDSPVIEPDSAGEFIESIADGNIGDFDSNVGKIGDVGIGRTEVAEYITLNEDTKEVERVWGFKTLLSRSRGLWELEKPYVNVFEPEFTCYITADRGEVQMETAAERSTPKDAIFTGNVVIHVEPRESSELKESFVYLDDMTFLSDRSQISTDGPVEYVSDDVHMRGRGLELIYNEQSERLQFFRIVDLEFLLLKNARTTMFAREEPKVDDAPEVVAQAEKPRAEEAVAVPRTEQADETVVAAEPEKTEEMTAEVAPVDETAEGVYYKCILSKNVFIDTPDELIFADQRILITDIFWSKDSFRSDPNEPNDAEAVVVAAAQEPAGDSNDTETVAVAVEEEPVNGSVDATASDGVATSNVTDPNVAEVVVAEPNALAEESGDIVITCDNGLVLVPMDTIRSLDEFMQVFGVSEVELPAEFETDTERTRFVTPRIDYNAVTGDVVADGESRLRLYSRDRDGENVNEPLTPTNIVAWDSVHFFHATNQIVFRGDCLGSMPQKGLTEPRDVTFESPEITVNLREDKSGRPDVLAAGPARLTFYVQDANDPNAAEAVAEPAPVTVTAQRQARFLAASNQIVFEDDCRCVTVREDANGVAEYMLLSELITVDLLEDSNDPSSELTGGIKNLTATGGVVRLVATRMAGTDPNLAQYSQDVNEPILLGGVELKCSRVDYDPGRGLFVASGPPAEIQMDNSKVTVSEQDPNGLSLSKPCYAFLANFDTLKYFINDKRIVAEAVPGGALWLHYVPVVDGVHDLDAITTASAQRVEAFLVEMPDGRTELSTLRATGGIDINDLSNGNHFLGSDLYYDHKTTIMKISGDEFRPCLCNGALVDKIEYNVTTGALDFDLVGPGAMQTNQQ